MPPWCAATSSKRLNCRGVNLTPRHLRWSKLHSGERSVMGSWRPALKAMQALKISRCFISNTIFKMNQMTTGHLEKRTPTSLRIAQLQCQPIWSVRYASISNDVGQHVPKVQVKLTIPEPFWKHWALGRAIGCLWGRAQTGHLSYQFLQDTRQPRTIRTIDEGQKRCNNIEMSTLSRLWILISWELSECSKFLVPSISVYGIFHVYLYIPNILNILNIL